jgi:hypothetical protein
MLRFAIHGVYFPKTFQNTDSRVCNLSPAKRALNVLTRNLFDPQPNKRVQRG